MATFGQLKSRIADKISQSDIDTQIGDAINSTIEYYQDQRMWFNEAISTITLTPDNPVVPNIPTDFLYEIPNGGLTVVFNRSRNPLIKKSAREYDLLNCEGPGIPRIYTNRANNLELYPFPQQAYDLDLFYVRDYIDLVSDSDTNDWTNNAERLIEAKTLSDLYIDQKKGIERYQVYLLKAEDEFKKLQRLNTRRTTTGNLLTENIALDNGSFNANYRY